MNEKDKKILKKKEKSSTWRGDPKDPFIDDLWHTMIDDPGFRVTTADVLKKAFNTSVAIVDGGKDITAYLNVCADFGIMHDSLGGQSGSPIIKVMSDKALYGILSLAKLDKYQGFQFSADGDPYVVSVKIVKSYNKSKSTLEAVKSELDVVAHQAQRIVADVWLSLKEASVGKSGELLPLGKQIFKNFLVEKLRKIGVSEKDYNIGWDDKGSFLGLSYEYKLPELKRIVDKLKPLFNPALARGGLIRFRDIERKAIDNSGTFEGTPGITVQHETNDVAADYESDDMKAKRRAARVKDIFKKKAEEEGTGKITVSNPISFDPHTWSISVDSEPVGVVIKRANGKYYARRYYDSGMNYEAFSTMNEAKQYLKTKAYSGVLSKIEDRKEEFEFADVKLCALRLGTYYVKGKDGGVSRCFIESKGDELAVVSNMKGGKRVMGSLGGVVQMPFADMGWDVRVGDRVKFVRDYKAPRSGQIIKKGSIMEVGAVNGKGWPMLGNDGYRWPIPFTAIRRCNGIGVDAKIVEALIQDVRQNRTVRIAKSLTCDREYKEVEKGKFKIEPFKDLWAVKKGENGEEYIERIK